MTARPAFIPPRATDWRYLLPRPGSGRFRRLTLVGASPSLVGAARSLGIADDVAERLTAGGGSEASDAVVVFRGAPVDASQVASALADNGRLFIEIDRRTPAGALWPVTRLTRALENVGLRIAASYAAFDGDSPRTYIPLSARHAFRWYVDLRARTSSRGAAVFLRLVRGTIGLDGERLGSVVPRYAVVAVRGSGLAIPSVLDSRMLESTIGDGARFPLLVLRGGDRVVALPFTANGGEPVAVIKAPRARGFHSRSENEQVTLVGLHQTLPAHLRPALPQPLGIDRPSPGEMIAIESVVDGESLHRICGSWGAPQAIRIARLGDAADWLARFHSETIRRRPEWAESRRSLLEVPFGEYARTFGTTADDERLFARALAYGDHLGGETALPIVFQHRDFNLWNLLWSERGLGVVDWEGARDGPALADLLHLVINWHDAVHGADEETAKPRLFRRLFMGAAPRDAYAGAAHQVIASYLTRLRIDRRLVPLLLLHVWVEQALRRADQRREQGDPEAKERRGNRAFPFLGVMARDFGDIVATWAAAT